MGESQIAVQQIGKGTIWLFNGSFSFVNAQLSDSFGRQTRAAYFVPILRTIPEGAVVQLDTYHLFGSLLGDAQEITSIQGWLDHTAWGNAHTFCRPHPRALSALAGATFGFGIAHERRDAPP